MSHRALEPLDAARIGDTRDPYRAERLRAQMQAARVVPARHAAFARLQASVGRPEPAPILAGPPVHSDGAAVEALRDHYTAHCLRNAVQAFRQEQARLLERGLAVSQALKDEQSALQARAQAANDLGTIQGLLPLQPYRVAAGLPAILPPALVMAASAAQGPAVAAVAAVAAPRNAPDDAFATDPAARAGIPAYKAGACA